MTADICLVSTPTLGRAKSPIVPHWMLWLTGHIEKQGYRVDIVDIKSDINEEFSERERERVFYETLERAVGSGSPLIGLSGFTEEYHDLVKLACAIKAKSNAKIIVGGVHATVSPHDFFVMEDSPFDIAVVGDGEVPLTRLIEAERGGAYSREEIEGLVFKKGNEVVHTEPQSAFPSLTDMPNLPYQKLDTDFYLQPHQFLTRWVYLSGFHIFTARGCPYSCTFCANRRRKVRYRTVDAVIEELRYLKETFYIDGFYVHDDTFTIKSDRVIEFCEKLMDLKYRFVWGMEGRVNQFPDNVFRALKKSGCIQIDFGVESGSQESLDRMKKGIKVEDTLAVFRRCNSENIRTFANFLINTPGETEQDISRTMKLMEKIKATVYGVCITTPYPGTAIYEQYVKPPLTIEEYRIYKGNKSYTSIVDPRFRLAAHNLNLEEIQQMLGEKYSQGRRWQIISFQPGYLRALFLSRRKYRYLSVFLFRLLRKFRNLLRIFPNSRHIKPRRAEPSA